MEIKRKIKRVERSLLRYCFGGQPEYTIGQCCDYIHWLNKFHKIPQEDIDFLADMAVVAMGMMPADEEKLFWTKYYRRKEQETGGI